jgi:hypothetical protein
MRYISFGGHLGRILEGLGWLSLPPDIEPVKSPGGQLSPVALPARRPASTTRHLSPEMDHSPSSNPSWNTSGPGWWSHARRHLAAVASSSIAIAVM